MTAGQVGGSRRAAWAAAVLVVALTLAAQAARLIEPDIAYNLYAPGRLLDGAKLYRDVVDMNPPLIFAFNLPIVWLARLTGVSDILLYRLATTLVLGAVLLVVRRLLSRYLLRDRPAARRYLLLGLCFALFPLAGEDFGEREHLVLALLLPYIVLAAGRLRPERISRGDAIGAGLLAGLALALKPQFVLPIMAVEGTRRLRRDCPNRLQVTPELAALVGVGVAYVLAVLTLTPEYQEVVAALGAAYTSYLRLPWLNLFLFAPWAALTSFALLAAASIRTVEPDRDGRTMLAAATIGCFLAGVAQQKGFRYHFYPSFALATVLLALVAAEVTVAVGPVARLYARLSRWLAAAIVVVVLGVSTLDAVGGSSADRRRRAEFLDLVRTVRVHSRGEPIGMLSYHMGSAFPLVNYAQVRLASRFPFLWLLPVSYWSDLGLDQPIRYHTLAEMRPPERLLNTAVTEDLLSARPRLLLILRPFPDERRYGFRRLNYVGYFGREPKLAALFAEYQLIATQGQYDIYERVDPNMTRAGAPPSAVVPPLQELHGQRPDAPPLVDPELAAGSVIFIALAIGSVVRRRSTR